MFSKPPREQGRRPHEAHRPSRIRARARHRGLAAVAATLIFTLAPLPTASALASASPSRPGGEAGEAKRPSSRSVRRLVTPGELLSPGELQKLISTLPLGDLSATQLAHYLAALQGVSVLAELKLGLLSSKELGVVGLEESLREAIEQLGPSAKLGELVKVEDFLPELNEALEGKLGDLGLLDLLLGKLPGSGSTGLEGALGTLSLEQLVGSLLQATTPHEQLAGELAALAGGLFGELGAENKLEGLLGGSELSSGFAAKTVREVSEELNTTPKVVSEELGQTAEQLPASATMLTAPLKDGKLAGVAPAVKGLVTGLLGNLGETPATPEGEGEEGGGKSGSGEGSGKGSGEGTGSGEGKGSGSGEGGKSSGSGEGKGGSGEGKGAGGQGGTSSGGTTTVLLSVPSTTPAAAAAKQKTGGKISIISHRVRGHLATIVVRVPTAGTAKLAGKGMRGASRQAARAERLTLRASLARAASSSLRHHHRLVVRLDVSFHPTSGSSSSSTVTVIFR